MAEYIEREAAEKAIAVLMPRMSTPDGTGCGDEYILSAQEAFVDAIAAVNNIPAAEVAPVVHAKWVICSDGYYPYCSNCSEEPKGGLSSFCPYCGAKMDLEE